MFVKDIGPQRINPVDFDDHMTFSLAPPLYENVYLHTS